MAARAARTQDGRAHGGVGTGPCTSPAVNGRGRLSGQRAGRPATQHTQHTAAVHCAVPVRPTRSTRPMLLVAGAHAVDGHLRACARARRMATHRHPGWLGTPRQLLCRAGRARAGLGMPQFSAAHGAAARALPPRTHLPGITQLLHGVGPAISLAGSLGRGGRRVCIVAPGVFTRGGEVGAVGGSAQPAAGLVPCFPCFHGGRAALNSKVDRQLRTSDCEHRDAACGCALLQQHCCCNPSPLAPACVRNLAQPATVHTLPPAQLYMRARPASWRAPAPCVSASLGARMWPPSWHPTAAAAAGPSSRGGS